SLTLRTPLSTLFPYTTLFRSSYNCWQVQSNSDQTTVYLTGNIDLFTLDHNLRCEGSLGITAQGCQHLTSLVVVGVNGLLAQNDQLGLLFVYHGLQQLGCGQGLNLFVSLDQDATIGAQSQGSTNLLLCGLRTDGNNHDFRRNALLFQAHSLFNCDFAEGIHCHFDVG